ncbi:hypothetical protein V8C26DRAFT_385046 [Trichoderma gracile]
MADAACCSLPYPKLTSKGEASSSKFTQLPRICASSFLFPCIIFLFRLFQDRGTATQYFYTCLVTVLSCVRVRSTLCVCFSTWVATVSKSRPRWEAFVTLWLYVVAYGRLSWVREV